MEHKTLDAIGKCPLYVEALNVPHQVMFKEVYEELQAVTILRCCCKVVFSPGPFHFSYFLVAFLLGGSWGSFTHGGRRPLFFFSTPSKRLGFYLWPSLLVFVK